MTIRGPSVRIMRLQHVDHLRDVGHAHAVGVLVEDVEVDAPPTTASRSVFCWYRKPGSRAGLDVVPGAPLVDEEADALVGS